MLRLFFLTLLLASPVGRVSAQILDMSERAQTVSENMAARVQHGADPAYYKAKKNAAYAQRPEFASNIAWDMFYHAGHPVWMCRDTKTENFVPPKFCAGKPKNDSRWPDTLTPPEFSGEIYDEAP